MAGTRFQNGSQGSTGGRVPVRLIAELGIIFVGVFGAFVAEDVRQQREDDQRARQTYAALLGEVRTFSERAPLVVAEMEASVQSWNEAFARGERLPPPFYREPRAETPPTAIWEATLASGGVALLDPNLFNELAVFYNRVVSTSDRFRRYSALTEVEVLPHLSDASHFYEDDGQLRGLYRMHVGLLTEIRLEIEQLISEAEVLEAGILSALER